MMSTRISAIVAIGKNRELGRSNNLLWRISDDLKRFKSLTTGHPIVMGRKTFDSIGKPLPNRTNIVVTRDASWTREGVLAMASLEEALTKARDIEKEEIFIVGGAQIYAQALPFTDRLYMTLIDAKKDADIYLPPYEQEFTKEISREERMDEKTGLRYTWLTLERS